MEISTITNTYGQKLGEISPKRASGATSANFKQNISTAVGTDVSGQDVNVSTQGRESIFSRESLSYLSDQEINFFSNQEDVTKYSKYGQSIEQKNVQSSLNIHI
ncbi:MAG: hypothetical protein LUG19_06070 [Desulfovibrio sp.]|uniref:hypothetical protein n=1 Tax=Desulfovibrio sp. TaxID=885 RepID=UPI002584EC89|nr:hypothetical protein [Desulfovibrio sp.]MCD7983807.1 hypothetical protein [Desulfovibrio sp.]